MNANRPCTHLAGEFFVAAELSKMGLNVAMTMGNAKKVDLVVENDSKTVPIQVKALAKKKNVGWPINLNHKYDSNLIFVCVVLNEEGISPEYYILKGSDVNRMKKTYKSRAILNIYSVKEFKDNWNLILKKLK
jgi:hypothetical protein